jgi:ribonucleoside-diphosphate reductase alpha chain
MMTETSERTPASFKVKKRDGATLQQFEFSKVETAIRKAWKEAYNGEVDEALVLKAARLVRDTFTAEEVGVEQIQDAVELTLMRFGQFEVARKYIVYRHRRTELRQARLQPDPSAVADYIQPGKYSRYLPELQRREVFSETVDRYEAMHLKKFAPLFETDPQLEKDIRWACDQIRAKKILPSMRGMQFAGPAVEQINARLFNCCATHVDRPRVFAEALYLLLCGCGVGFSVQYEHVEKLPALKQIDHTNVVHFTIPDTVEGWADALDKLVHSYIKGYYIEFNYSRIRPEGTPLKTSGGAAPGHLELKKSLEAIREILDGATGRKLKPIEAYDVMCRAADAVLSGGIRRSAMICLFSADDSEMMCAKTGNWYAKYPWRTNSNNSVVLVRGEVKKAQYKRVFGSTRQFGEPGISWTNNPEYAWNPCHEVCLNPVLNVDDDVMALLQERNLHGKGMPKVKLGDRQVGWAFCNLSTQNAAEFKSAEDFKTAARAAAIVGTLQSAYTDFAYLGWVSETIAEREALIGVSMTGMMDSPTIALDPALQREVAELVVATNKEFAARIGVRQSARTTVIKPEGTGSLLLGGVGAGHHPHHSRRYIRRVVANELEPVFVYFRSINPHLCTKKPDGDWVIEFPMAAPEGALVKADMSAVEFLESVRQTQLNWVKTGTARPDSSPGAVNNVSATCTVKETEWDAVAEYTWEYRNDLTGISFIPDTGDKQYAFAPFEAVVTEADEEKWNSLLRHYTPVDYTKMVESTDGTHLTGEAACAGGACTV